MCTVRLRSQEAAKLRAGSECRIFLLFSCFFCEIELISMKFMRYFCKIPVFQIGPEQFRRSNDL